MGLIKPSVDCSYKGDVTAYISSASDATKYFKFSNVVNKKPICFTETTYWEQLYLSK